MKFSRRTVAKAFVAVGSLLGALVAAAPIASAGSAVPNPCGANFATLSPSGSLDTQITRTENVNATPWVDHIALHSGISTMSSVSHTYLQNSGRHYFRNLVVKGGILTHAMTSYPNDDPARRTTSMRAYGPGWGPMTRLVDASDQGTVVTKKGYLYALNPTAGTLSRYSVVEGRNFGDLTFRSAGSAAGYKNFRGLTLLHRYRAGYAGAADVLYATTTGGALYQITIPNTSAYAPKLSLVRASSWTFDQLAAVQCDSTQLVLGVRTGADRAYIYRVNSYAGTSSAITGYGQVGSSWIAAHTTGYWESGFAPSRW